MVNILFPIPTGDLMKQFYHYALIPTTNKKRGHKAYPHIVCSIYKTVSS